MIAKNGNDSVQSGFPLQGYGQKHVKRTGQDCLHIVYETIATYNQLSSIGQTRI